MIDSIRSRIKRSTVVNKFLKDGEEEENYKKEIDNRIELMKKYVEENGFQLYCFNEKQIHYGGRIDYDEKWICINEPLLEGAVKTLLHEVGHLKSYLKNNNNERETTKEFREEVANKHGWVLREKFGIDITKEEWRRYSTESSVEEKDGI